MGRGVSSGGGQSSLGYLFGSGEPAAAAPARAKPSTASTDVERQQAPTQKPAAAAAASSSNASPPADVAKQVPAGIPGSKSNNYFRADGQNCGNFITDRPTTKVHAAPGGGSSLDYLFGNGGGK